MTEVAALEQAGYDTWTPDDTAELGGWTVHATDGYTRRVNCARGQGALPTDPDIRAAVTSWLIERGATPIVRVTPLLDASTVEGIKRFWGYRAVDETLVLTAPVRRASPTRPVGRMACDDDDFLAELARLNGRSPETAAVRKRMMTRVANRASGLWIPGVGVGLVVASDRFAAVYSVAVEPNARRQGVAKAIMAEAGAWSAERGCDTTFLQVLGNNKAAVRLYESLGFAQRYSYHYLEPETE